jgi:hypothetical protein
VANNTDVRRTTGPPNRATFRCSPVNPGEIWVVSDLHSADICGSG